MNFKEGQKVNYKNKETHIETLNDDGSCIIANPIWNWDEESLCVDEGFDYDVPYWINVNITELNCV
jgi:hypothetical protein